MEVAGEHQRQTSPRKMLNHPCLLLNRLTSLPKMTTKVASWVVSVGRKNDHLTSKQLDVTTTPSPKKEIMAPITIINTVQAETTRIRTVATAETIKDTEMITTTIKATRGMTISIGRKT